MQQFEQVTETTDSFESAGFKPNILRGIYGTTKTYSAYGFEEPSKLQQRTLPSLLKGRDIFIQAQAGMGKTLVCLMSALQRIDSDLPCCQALVLCPTRELAYNISGAVRPLASFTDLKMAVIVGGVSMAETKRQLQQVNHIVAGTPGRMEDVLRRQFLRPDAISVIIIDEADEIMTRGFSDQISVILSKLPQRCQIVLNTSTSAPEILGLVDKWMKQPVKVVQQYNERTLVGVRQYYLEAEDQEKKLGCLVDILTAANFQQAIIYVNKNETANTVSNKLKQVGLLVATVTLPISTEELEMTLRNFRQGLVRYIVSSNAMDRLGDLGTCVINYDLPNRKEHYIYRAGRKGRFGRFLCINLMTPQQRQWLNEIRRFYNQDIVELPMDMSMIY